jgi:3-oxoacyl-[acyl-carrier protein] reductase
VAAITRQAIVSGGGTGMGRAIASAFAQLGDDVLVLGRREHVLAEAAGEINAAVGREAVTLAAVDLEDADAVASLEPRLPQVVDVLVNNAGGREDAAARRSRRSRPSSRTTSRQTA